MWYEKYFIFLILLLEMNYDNVQTHRHGHVAKCHHHHHHFTTKKTFPPCKRWCLIYIDHGFCKLPRYVCCSFKEKPGYCPASVKKCAFPFPYHLTHIHECCHDFHCPLGHKCCHDSCYVHKVCKPIAIIHPTTSTTSPGETETTSFATEFTTRSEASTTAFTEETTLSSAKTTTKGGEIEIPDPPPSRFLQIYNVANVN